MVKVPHPTSHRLISKIRIGFVYEHDTRSSEQFLSLRGSAPYYVGSQLIRSGYCDVTIGWRRLPGDSNQISMV